MKIPVDPPFKYEDYDISEIDLCLKEKVTPRAQEMLEAKYKREVLSRIKDLDSETRAMYNMKPMMDRRFCLVVFEWLTGYPKDVIRNDAFPIETYNVILDAISYFFMNWREPSTELPPDLGEAETDL